MPRETNAQYRWAVMQQCVRDQLQHMFLLEEYEQLRSYAIDPEQLFYCEPLQLIFTWKESEFGSYFFQMDDTRRSEYGEKLLRFFVLLRCFYAQNRLNERIARCITSWERMKPRLSLSSFDRPSALDEGYQTI